MSKPAFVALQDRYVSSLAVACCPTMDLVAVITLDRHLLVHRTTSWQKLLHIKPSDVGFEMAMLVWRPDGLQLAVGCDEGDVALVEIESGEVLPETRYSFRHEHAITAMQWTAIIDTKSNESISKHRRSGDDQPSTSQAKRQFYKRATRFLPGYSEPSGGDSMLVTADAKGQLALWWMGRVLLTHVNVQTYFTTEEAAILNSLKQDGGPSSFRIERVDIAPDLSLLFVVVAFFVDETDADKTNDSNGQRKVQVHRLLTLDLRRIQDMGEDVMLVASTLDRMNTIVNQVVSNGKKMVAEWKNATRIFELKMGLIGSLYEKYACDDPPQVDMLSAIVSGITAPALAQYFAQDIQEMSVHRMQKMFFSGCDTLEKLISEHIRRDLVDFLFSLSELRGHAIWNSEGYSTTLGISVTDLDRLEEAAQDTLLSMEMLTLAIHETRQDFAQFFLWLLECIRTHANSTRPSDAGQNGSNGNNPRDAGGSKSLLNIRRLCDFLQLAADAARHFQSLQPAHNKYKVESTFGNPVSRLLLPTRVGGDTSTSTQGCIILSERIKQIWTAMLETMATTVGRTVTRQEACCFTIGNCDNQVLESHFCFRHPFRARHISKSIVDEDNEANSDSDDTDEEEAVDWSSLKYFGTARDVSDTRYVMLLGFRKASGALVLVRVSRHSQHSDDSPFSCEAAAVHFSRDVSGNTAVLSAFDFYGDAPSEKTDQFALVLEQLVDNRARQEWLCLQTYDDLDFSPIAISTTDIAKLCEVEGSVQTIQTDRTRGRIVASSQLSSNRVAVIAIASRGTLCVTLEPSRLTVFDAEDSEDEDDNDDDEDQQA